MLANSSLYGRGSQNGGHGPKVARGGVESGPPSPFEKNVFEQIILIYEQLLLGRL